MEEVKNITFEEVQEVIKTFPLVPRFTKVYVTVNVDEEDDLQLGQAGLSERQYVIAKGSMIHDLKPGNKVILDLDKMMTYTTNPDNTHEQLGQIKIDPIRVDDRVFIMIEDKYIKAIDNSEEE